MVGVVNVDDIDARCQRLEARLEARAYRLAQRRLALDALQERFDAQRERAKPAGGPLPEGSSKQTRGDRLADRRSRQSQKARQMAHAGQAGTFEPPVHVFVYLASLRAPAQGAEDTPASLDGAFPASGWTHVRLALAGGGAGSERTACEPVFSCSAPCAHACACDKASLCYAWSQHFCIPMQAWQLPTLCVRAELWWSARRQASDEPDVLLAAGEVDVPLSEGGSLEAAEVHCALSPSGGYDGSSRARTSSSKSDATCGGSITEEPGQAAPQAAPALLCMQLTARALSVRGAAGGGGAELPGSSSSGTLRDEYGFLVAAEHAAHFERAHAKSHSADASAWLSRWNLLLRTWPAGARGLDDADARCALSLVRLGGVPLQHRAEVWRRAMACPCWGSEPAYRSLLARVDAEERAGSEEALRTREQIERDLPRTFPEHGGFRCGSPLCGALRRVLRALSVANRAVGYCQSLNFVCALLLLVCDELRAFSLLCALCAHVLPDYWTESLAGVSVDAELLHGAICRAQPRLCEHLSEHGVPLRLMYTRWLMCAFSNLLPPSCLFALWDSLFLAAVPAPASCAAPVLEKQAAHSFSALPSPRAPAGVPRAASASLPALPTLGAAAENDGPGAAGSVEGSAKRASTPPRIHVEAGESSGGEEEAAAPTAGVRAEPATAPQLGAKLPLAACGGNGDGDGDGGKAGRHPALPCGCAAACAAGGAGVCGEGEERCESRASPLPLFTAAAAILQLGKAQLLLSDDPSSALSALHAVCAPLYDPDPLLRAMAAGAGICATPSAAASLLEARHLERDAFLRRRYEQQSARVRLPRAELHRAHADVLCVLGAPASAIDFSLSRAQLAHALGCAAAGGAAARARRAAARQLAPPAQGGHRAAAVEPARAEQQPQPRGGGGAPSPTVGASTAAGKGAGTEAAAAGWLPHMLPSALPASALARADAACAAPAAADAPHAPGAWEEDDLDACSAAAAVGARLFDLVVSAAAAPALPLAPTADGAPDGGAASAASSAAASDAGGGKRAGCAQEDASMAASVPAVQPGDAVLPICAAATLAVAAERTSAAGVAAVAFYARAGRSGDSISAADARELLCGLERTFSPACTRTSLPIDDALAELVGGGVVRWTTFTKLVVRSRLNQLIQARLEALSINVHGAAEARRALARATVQHSGNGAPGDEHIDLQAPLPAATASFTSRAVAAAQHLLTRRPDAAPAAP